MFVYYPLNYAILASVFWVELNETLQDMIASLGEMKKEGIIMIPSGISMEWLE
jgi:hypothetical protein